MSRSNGTACRLAAHNSSSASLLVRSWRSASSPRSWSSTPLIVCAWLRSRLSASLKIADSLWMIRRRRPENKTTAGKRCSGPADYSASPTDY